MRPQPRILLLIKGNRRLYPACEALTIFELFCGDRSPDYVPVQDLTILALVMLLIEWLEVITVKLLKDPGCYGGRSVEVRSADCY